MSSSAIGLAWEFWGRYRWGMAAFAVYVLVCGIVAAAVPLLYAETFAVLASIWFMLGQCFLIVVFSHGSEVRVDTADSGFPTRTFVLPVRTSVLVGWPMLQGALAAVLAWVAWDRLVLRPCGMETPFWWTPMLAAIVVTTQAVLWVPFGLPWVRVPVAVAALTGLVRAPYFLALAGDRFADPETENLVLSMVAAAVIPTAFLLGRAGVARARRGDSPDWLRVFRAHGGEPWRERPPFATPMRAQVWYEWRLRGVGFPRLVLFTIAFLVVCGVLLERDDDRRAGFGMTFLVIPVLLAGFCGSYLGATGDSVRALFGLPAFAATRPLTSSAIVAAKLWAAALAAALSWTVALGLTAGWLAFNGAGRELPRLWELVVANVGPARAVGLALLAAVGPPVLVWRLLIGDLWVGLTGRAWIGYTQAIVTGTVGLHLLHEWTTWKVEPARYDRFAEVIPWVVGPAVVVKVLAAGWLLRALVRRGEVGRGIAGRVLAGWVLAAGALFALLVWLIPPEFAPVYGLALGVALFIPLTRLAAAPLALAWNRHR